MDTLPREHWVDAEPQRATREREEMAREAPELEWLPEGGWEGLIPVWPFDRPRPAELDAFLNDRRLRVRIEYPESFPMVEPSIFPLDPEPEIYQRTQTQWHVMGDGSLCLFQNASDWTGRETAADLIVRTAGWFLEYALMQRGLIDEMTRDGIVSDGSLDHLFGAESPPSAARRNEDSNG